MSVNDESIKTTNWLVKGVSQQQLKTEKALSIISARIFTKRTALGMDQKQFANFMGVSQGMVSRWESGTYNFTIATLIGICDKLDLDFEPQIYEQAIPQQNVKIVAFNNDKRMRDWDDWSPKSKSKDSLGKGVA